jgi:hydroxyethylthiazole kinase-like uncharacterized protein yjeF
VLCTGGARRGGSGYLRFAGTSHPVELIRHRFPDVVATEVDHGDGQAVLDAGRVQAWVVGPGLGTDDAAAGVVEAVLGSDVPVLVDADGLTIIARHPEWLRARFGRGQLTLLTPHEGEFARLAGGEPADVKQQLAADRLGTVRRLSAQLPATILLKGSTTLVVDPTAARVNATGVGWLASAGTGDVLSGIAGGLLAAGLSPFDAGSVGAWLHGAAAQLAVELNGPPLAALDLLDALPKAWQLARAAAEESQWRAPKR